MRHNLYDVNCELECAPPAYNVTSLLTACTFTLTRLTFVNSRTAIQKDASLHERDGAEWSAYRPSDEIFQVCMLRDALAKKS